MLDVQPAHAARQPMGCWLHCGIVSERCDQRGPTKSPLYSGRSCPEVVIISRQVSRPSCLPACPQHRLALPYCHHPPPVLHVLTPQASFPAGSTSDFSAISQGMAQWASQLTSRLLFSESVCEPNLGSGSGPEPLPVDFLLIDVTRRALAGRRGPPSRLLLLPPSRWWSVSLVCILFSAPCLSVGTTNKARLVLTLPAACCCTESGARSATACSWRANPSREPRPVMRSPRVFWIQQMLAG